MAGSEDGQRSAKNDLKFVFHRSSMSIANRVRSLKSKTVLVRALNVSVIKEFYVHEHLLAKSIVLKNALREPLTPGNPEIIVLKGYSLDVLEAHLQSLYSSRTDEIHSEHSRVQWKSLIESYDTAKTPEAKDRVVDSMLRLFEESEGTVPEVSLVKHAYTSYPADPKLVSLMTDMWCWAATAQDLPASYSRLTPRFYVDLATALLKRRGKPAGESSSIPSDVNRCDYHTHKKDELCSSRKRKRGDDNDGAKDGATKAEINSDDETATEEEDRDTNEHEADSDDETATEEEERETDEHEDDEKEDNESDISINLSAEDAHASAIKTLREQLNKMQKALGKMSRK